MDNFGVYIKALLTSLLTAITLQLGHIGELLWLFLAAMCLDYITGVVAAAYNKRLNSGVGLRGVIKKVGQCFIIAVAIISDNVVAQAAEYFEVSISPGGALVTIVTIWLILNELISILENIAGMDVALPPFLLSAIKMLKKKAEISGDKSTPEDGGDKPGPEVGGEK